MCNAPNIHIKSLAIKHDFVIIFENVNGITANDKILKNLGVVVFLVFEFFDLFFEFCDSLVNLLGFVSLAPAPGTNIRFPRGCNCKVIFI